MNANIVAVLVLVVFSLHALQTDAQSDGIGGPQTSFSVERYVVLNKLHPDGVYVPVDFFVGGFPAQQEMGAARTLLFFADLPLTKVERATLHLTVVLDKRGTSSNEQILEIHPVLEDWEKPSWNAQPTFDQVVASVTIERAGEYDVDVTSLVNSWIANPSKNYGVVLKAASEDVANLKEFSRTAVISTGDRDDALPPSPDKPDLIVEDILFDEIVDTDEPTYRASVTFANRGTKASGRFGFEMYHDDRLILSSDNLPPLAPGDTDNHPLGSWQTGEIRVIVDPENLIDETSEENNERTERLGQKPCKVGCQCDQDGNPIICDENVTCTDECDPAIHPYCSYGGFPRPTFSTQCIIQEDGCYDLFEEQCGDDEYCDDGPGICDPLCEHFPNDPSCGVCGDGVVDSGEQCDDGNAVDGDGCSSTCELETVCGNGVCEEGEFICEVTCPECPADADECPPCGESCTYFCPQDCLDTSTCIDTDGGIDYDVAGTCKDDRGKSQDTCIGDSVEEFYCTPEAFCEIDDRDNVCENGCFEGGCIDAACLTHELEITGTENQNGKLSVSYRSVDVGDVQVALLPLRVITPGRINPLPEHRLIAPINTTLGNRTRIGICRITSGGCGGSTNSSEVFCTVNTDCDYPDLSEGDFAVELTDLTCRHISDKAIVEPEPECTDSDGANIFVKGTVVVTHGAIVTTHEDVCVIDPVGMTASCEGQGCGLFEYVCNDEGLTSAVPQRCEHGCEDGACVRDDVCSLPEPIQGGTGGGGGAAGNGSFSLFTEPSGDHLMFFREELGIDTGELSALDSRIRRIDDNRVQVSGDGTPLLMTKDERGLHVASFDGYIVELVQEPLLVREKQITGEQEGLQAKVDRASGISAVVSWPVTVFRKAKINRLEKKRGSYEGDLIDGQQQVLEDVGLRSRNPITGAVTADGDGEFTLTKAFNGFVVDDVDDRTLKKIREHTLVKRVVPNFEVSIALDSSVPAVNAPALWERGVTGEGVTIAILDTGVDYTHPDLGGCFGGSGSSGGDGGGGGAPKTNDAGTSGSGGGGAPNPCKVIGGFDFVNFDGDPIDDHGHGTHVAATAAGNACSDSKISEPPSSLPDNCEALKYNGDFANSLSLVFVPSGFEGDLDAFRDEVEKIWKEMDQFAPYSHANQQLNAFLTTSDAFQPSFCDLGCFGTPRLLCCDTDTAKKLSSACYSGPRQTIVVHNSENYGGAGYMDEDVVTVTRNATWGPRIAAHEMGHSLFSLGDEYDAFSTAANSPNCDGAQCSKWDDLLGYEEVNCQPGRCDNEQYFSSETSIMHSLNEDFEEVNERITCCVYHELTGSYPSYCDQFLSQGDGLQAYCEQEISEQNVAVLNPYSYEFKNENGEWHLARAARITSGTFERAFVEGDPGGTIPVVFQLLGGSSKTIRISDTVQVEYPGRENQLGGYVSQERKSFSLVVNQPIEQVRSITVNGQEVASSAHIQALLSASSNVPSSVSTSTLSTSDECSTGFRGVAPDASLYAYKVLGAGGSGSTFGILSAIEASLDPNGDGDTEDHVDIISMSLGRRCFLYNEDCGPDDPLSIAADNAVEAGVVVTIAAGNSGSRAGTIGSPGTARDAITVGAFCEDHLIGIDPRCPGAIASFSSRGPVIHSGGVLMKPDVVAPGAAICAAQAAGTALGESCGDQRIAISGTSMATPHVAGAAALLLQAHPDWTPGHVKSALMQSAVDVGQDRVDQGSGLIDVHEADQLDILVTPALMEFELMIDELPRPRKVTITNTRDEDVNFDLEADCSVGILSENSITVPAGGSEDVWYSIFNFPQREGAFAGDIHLFGSQQSYTVPFSLAHFSELTIDVAGTEDGQFDALVTDQNFANKKTRFSFEPKTFLLPSGNYLVAVGGDGNRPQELSYLLMETIDLPKGTRRTHTLDPNDAKEVRVPAHSRTGEPLIHDFGTAYTVYNDRGCSVTYHFDYPAFGDQIVRVSPKPEGYDAAIHFKYVGVPSERASEVRGTFHGFISGVCK